VVTFCWSSTPLCFDTPASNVSDAYIHTKYAVHSVWHLESSESYIKNHEDGSFIPLLLLLFADRSLHHVPPSPISIPCQSYPIKAILQYFYRLCISLFTSYEHDVLVIRRYLDDRGCIMLRSKLFSSSSLSKFTIRG
jgi:hypothetical protein